MSHTTTTVVTRQVTSSGGTTHVTTGNRDWNTDLFSCAQDCKNCTPHCTAIHSLSLSLSLSLCQSVSLSVCLRFLLKLVYYSLQSLHHVPVVPQFFRLEHTANNLRAFQNCTSSSLKPDQKAKESLTLNKIWISFFFQ